jgi:hypothetical protein
MFLLTNRQARAVFAAAAGAAAYLGASQIGARKLRLSGLFILTTASLAGVMTASSSAKARNVENRLNNFLNNGGQIGGNLVVSGDHSVSTLHVNGTQLKMQRGSHGNPPGGAPGSYTPSYESSLSQLGADIISACQAAGIFN